MGLFRKNHVVNINMKLKDDETVVIGLMGKKALGAIQVDLDRNLLIEAISDNTELIKDLIDYNNEFLFEAFEKDEIKRTNVDILELIED